MTQLQGKLIQLTQSLTQAHGDIQKTKTDYTELQIASSATIQAMVAQSQTSLDNHKRDVATLYDQHVQSLAND